LPGQRAGPVPAGDPREASRRARARLVRLAGDVGRVAVLAARRAGWVNVKPSRIGSLETLFAVYAHCDAAGLPMYGGGMGELAVGRRQIQLLASLFHPDGPNDVAPSDFNLADLPDDLPRSPLVLREELGFR
jgi:hypothetical protein